MNKTVIAVLAFGALGNRDSSSAGIRMCQRNVGSNSGPGECPNHSESVSTSVSIAHVDSERQVQ